MSKDIVVMIDMQNDFIDGSLGSPAAQAIVPKVVEYIKSLSQDVPVFYTLDTHNDGTYLTETLEGKMLPVKHCIEDTHGWHLNSELEHALCAPERMCAGVCCQRKDTFGSRDLMVRLKAAIYDSRNPERPRDIVFHVLGLCTDICVSVNALLLRTAFPNNRIICHADMCAGTSPEAHKAALTVMKSCQIEIEGE